MDSIREAEIVERVRTQFERLERLPVVIELREILDGIEAGSERLRDWLENFYDRCEGNDGEELERRLEEQGTLADLRTMAHVSRTMLNLARCDSILTPDRSPEELQALLDSIEAERQADATAVVEAK